MSVKTVELGSPVPLVVNIVWFMISFSVYVLTVGYFNISITTYGGTSFTWKSWRLLKSSKKEGKVLPFKPKRTVHRVNPYGNDYIDNGDIDITNVRG